jgi:beta-lactamase regulating signal transducer with metallopeptidase domain
MIAAWMLYTTVITLVLFAGARAAEYVARALGAPARGVWLVAMIASLGLSGRALRVGSAHADDASPRADTTISLVPVDVVVSAGGVQGVATRSSLARRFSLQNMLIATRAAAASAGRLVRRLDVRPLERWNDTLLGIWIAGSLLAALWYAASLTRAWRIERRLDAALVDDQPVLLSTDVGPALFGILRSRIVLPRWVLSLPAAERRMIIAHEREHAAACDPTLLCAAALIVSLQPWNIVLWALFAGLRLALEGDCDRRVLATVGDARRYGSLLIAVYMRSAPGLTPHMAFVQRPSNLEQRIRRMTRRPRLLSAGGVSAAGSALILATAAWTTAGPVRRATAAPVASPAVTPIGEGTREWSVSVPAPPPRPWTVVPDTIETTRTPPRADATEAAAPSQEALPPRAAASPVRTQATLCGFTGIMRGASGAVTPPRTEAGCSVYGDVAVLAIDTAHILVAMRDTADDQPSVGYIIFTVVPRGPRFSGVWTSRAGRTAFSGTDFYVASPTPGDPTIVFSAHDGGRPAGDADTIRVTITAMSVGRSSAFTWDDVRQMSPDAQCALEAVAPRVATGGRAVVVRDTAATVSGRYAYSVLQTGTDGFTRRRASACFVVGERNVVIPG